MKTYHIEKLVGDQWIARPGHFVLFHTAYDELEAIIRETKREDCGCYRIVRTITETDVVCSKSFNL